MYTIIKMICIIACLIMGALMVLIPQKVVRKDWREDEAKLKQSRVLGVVIVALCIIILI